MSSRKSSNTSNVLGLLAFLAIIVKALAYILSFLKIELGILVFAADLILTAVALIVAWSFAKTCNKNWRIVYFVILALVVVGFVLGGLSL